MSIIIYEYAQLFMQNRSSHYKNEFALYQAWLVLIRWLFVIMSYYLLVTRSYGYVLAGAGVSILELFLFDLKNIMKGAEQANIITLKKKEKSIALYGNALSFLGVAIPSFIEIFFPNDIVCGKGVNFVEKSSEKSIAVWFGVLLLAIILLGVRCYSECIWDQIEKMEQDEKNLQRKMWEEIKSQLS